MSQGNVKKVSIVDIMERRWLDYAMSVNVSRAIPDVRDGLKPVHRRVLYAMYDLKMTHSSQYKKSARIVGEVIGKYHPHGDSSVYDSLVRMQQKWNLRAPLIDGHGNYGSIDGLPAAAMRYTEARLHKISSELLRDINKDTVDYGDNFDGSEKEPIVLPSRFPNLLVNGTQGIAVGLACVHAPHNLREVIDAVVHLIDNPDAQIEELAEYIEGPDFPTGGYIMGTDGINSAFLTGNGSITIRGKCHIEETDKHTQLVITELPYQVPKQALIDKIDEEQIKYNRYEKDLNNNKQVEKQGHDFRVPNGIRDETSRVNKNNTVRIVITLKRDANPESTLNHLYKHTPLQTTFSVNSNVLVPKKDNRALREPKLLNLKQMIEEYVVHQKEVVTRKSNFELKERQKEVYFLDGLIKALDKLQETIDTIKNAPSRRQALLDLMSLLDVNEDQADSILKRQLSTIANFEQDEKRIEHQNLVKEIKRLETILSDETEIMNIIKDDLKTIKEKYGEERRTEILPAVEDIDYEDTLPNEENVVTITNEGYIKRTPGDAYRTQRRKGRGINGMQTHDGDFIEHLELVYTKDTLLFFTNYGRVYKLKAYKIRENLANARGIYINTLINLQPGEKIQSVLPIKEFSDEQHLIFATKNGIVKKTLLSKYENIRRNGINAIRLDKDDLLIGVKLTSGDNDVILVTKKGMSITFNESEVRNSSRDTRGVKGITLSSEDDVISLDIHKEFADLFVATNNGYGKRTPCSEFRPQRKGGKGFKAIRLTEKNGEVVGTCAVTEEDQLMLITKNAFTVKLEVSEISQFSRNTQGTTVINLKKGDSLVRIARNTEEEFDEE